ncbi:MAG: glycoside hydrolase [Candidatus Hydrogenedentes bacterium]|nr:glycoside hydrolase [Candidatus Hydrogenedentota bacterium]
MRFAIGCAISLLLLVCASHSQQVGPETDIQDLALKAPLLNTSPGPEYTGSRRLFQGIPGLERTRNGRLWATWYGGGKGEDQDNYCMLATSGDNGATWSTIKAVVDPAGDVRAFDPCLWIDPKDTLWFFWAQGFNHWDGRAGVWCVTTNEPDNETPSWTEPRRICDGIMMNKPTVLSGGTWMLPVAIWAFPAEVMRPEYAHNIAGNSGSKAYGSTDQGATWNLLGYSDVNGRSCDEHMIVERKDNSLWMLVRTDYGVGESISLDGGKTWSPGQPCTTITHIPSARFFIRRLASERILLVKHNPPNGKIRSHLTAYLSDDDGKSWNGGLVVDERKSVSYPDGVQAPDGTIYIIYDFERKAAREILLATFTEDDVMKGQFASGMARPRVLVNKATN